MRNYKNALKRYINRNMKEPRFSFSKLFEKADFEDYSEAEAELSNTLAGSRAFKCNKDILAFIDEYNDYNDFQTLLFKYIDERNLKDSDVYNKVHIDRRLFSKIRSDKNYHPSKETIILLGFSLELTEEEIEKLLDSASYSLPKNNHYDLIIRFCFIKGIYKISEVNSLLDEYGCKLFNY